jgi:hypothetical protein
MSSTSIEQGRERRPVNEVTKNALGALALRVEKGRELNRRMIELAARAGKVANTGSWGEDVPDYSGGLLQYRTIHGTQFVEVDKGRSIAVRETKEKVESRNFDNVIVGLFLKEGEEDPIKLAIFTPHKGVTLTGGLGEPKDIGTVKDIEYLLDHVGASDQK